MSNDNQQENAKVRRRKPSTSFEKAFKTIIEQLKSEHYHGSILFSGPAGIGKTSTVLNFGRTLGIPVVVIEVPHITEEHLINIPFIVVNQDGKSGGTSTAEVKGDPNSSDAHSEFWKETGEYKIILANSVLFTTVSKQKVVNDEEYLEYINNQASNDCRSMFFKYGGNETTIPPIFQTIRKNISAILFIDELYRNTSPNIRNMLRGLMDGFIGKHKLPKSVFQLYASNMVDTGGDGGIEEVAEHEHYLEVEFTPPTKEEWFNWFTSKYISHSVMGEQSDVILDYFQNALQDEDISFTDYKSSVRTSPRRWEQLMLYILSSLPAKTQNDADSLLTHVKLNFIHYKTEEFSEDLMKKVVKATKELIKITSNFSDSKVKDNTEWKDIIDHYLKQYMKIGSARKHVPVLTGLPGTSKTATAYQIASENHLDLIMVNATTLSRDDVEGQPVPQNIDSDNIDVAFSPSKLYQLITEGMRNARSEHLKMLKELYANDSVELNSKIQEYETRKWKYMVFFDELNRVKPNTFNSLRKVLLEKEFGVDGNGKPITLPKSTIFIAAINPNGKNTQEFTDHFRDVVDIIPVAPDFKRFESYISKLEFKNADADVTEQAKHFLYQFLQAFNSGRTTSDNKFYLTLGQEAYVDQRTLTAVFNQLVIKLTAAMEEVKELEMEYDDADNNEKLDIIKEHISDAIMMGVGFKLTHVSGIDREVIVDKVNAWLDTVDTAEFENMLSSRHGQAEHISKIYERCITGEIDIANLAANDSFLSHISEASDQELKREVTSAIIAAFVSKNNNIDDMIKVRNLPSLNIVKGEYGLEIQKEGTENETLLGYFSKGILFSMMLNQQTVNRLTSMGKGMSEAVVSIANTVLKENPDFVYEEVDEDTGETYTITNPEKAVKHFISVYGLKLRTELHEITKKANELYET